MLFLMASPAHAQQLPLSCVKIPNRKRQIRSPLQMFHVMHDHSFAVPAAAFADLAFVVVKVKRLRSGFVPLRPVVKFIRRPGRDHGPQLNQAFFRYPTSYHLRKRKKPAQHASAWKLQHRLQEHRQMQNKKPTSITPLSARWLSALASQKALTSNDIHPMFGLAMSAPKQQVLRVCHLKSLLGGFSSASRAHVTPFFHRKDNTFLSTLQGFSLTFL